MNNSRVIMPEWGPYSKKYMGISHIAQSRAGDGARMDFIIHPTLWNSSVPVPNTTIPSNYHLWSCDSDFRFYSYRYELMWKDLIYADVSWSRMSKDAYLMRCEFFNNTEFAQNCILNLFAALEFPHAEYCEVKTPLKCELISANSYKEYSYFVPRPWDTENPDGMHKGEFDDPNFYLGKGLGDRCENYHVDYLGLKPFGCEAGDKVSYQINAADFESPVLAVRYRTVSNRDAIFELNDKQIAFTNSSNLTIAYFDISRGDIDITLKSLGAGGIELDFIAVIEKGTQTELTANVKLHSFTPKVTCKNIESGLKFTLSYNETGEIYTIITNNSKTRQRFIDSGCLEDALINRLSNGDPTYDRLKETFSGSFKEKKSDEGYYKNILIPSIFIDPGTSHTEYIIVAKGDIDMPCARVCETIYNDAKMTAAPMSYNSGGMKYQLSTEIMKATLLTNIVYPVYKHGENIMHYTPGKRWDSFYTWDSGIIGMGILEFAPDKAQYILETYTADSDNKDFAFLLHGSLVPTQFAQYLEMLKRAEDKTALLELYPRMKRYYSFIAGKAEGSTCGKFLNGLTTAYDYWYSCSGMDDYPAQVAMIAQDKKQYMCPCISTSHTIRAAKILKMAADALGNTADIKEYDYDIKRMSDALNKYSWDEKSGYYAYSVYDDDKNYKGIFCTDNGENYNKGIDGIYPLIAGAAPAQRRKRLLSHIKNPEQMWSAAGISAVDMTSSYYFDDGYWNGNVWMGHQYFIWKTMFDLGETDFAFEIAKRALDMWKNETDFTYNTYECFGIKTLRGGWFHNFGGLSAPISIWACAYYKPGTVTTGFDVWTDYQNATDDSAEIKFKYFGDSDRYSMVITLSDKYSYNVMLNGKIINYKSHSAGSMEITLDGGVKSGILSVVKK